MIPLPREQLLELAAQYGTPLYVYNGDLIIQRYQELFRYIPWQKLRILYAMKANYNPGILRLLQPQNCWLDTVSPAEVLLAKKIGFSEDRILYTANNMTAREVEQVHQAGVLLNIGSLSELERYGKSYPGSRVCLRLNPDVVAGAHKKIQTGGKITKFGILLEDVNRAREIVARHGLHVVGLHEHTGSGIKETAAFHKSMRNLLRIALPDYFPELQFVDFGGGFQIPYRPDETRIDYAGMGAEIARKFAAFCEKIYGKSLWLYFEPGRYIVAEAGCMLVQVNTLKNNRGRLIAGTNSGFPQLIRPMFYDAYHHIANLSNPAGEPLPYDVCGNICETGDRFAEQRDIPEIREGDFLAILDAGAYCHAMGGVYNLRPMPTELLTQSGTVTSIRRGLANEELVDQILGECR